MTPKQIRMGMSRFKAAEDLVNRMLVQGVNIEKHWRESNPNKKNTEKEISGLHGEDTKGN